MNTESEPRVVMVSRDELLDKVRTLRQQHVAVSRLPRLPEIEEELDHAYFLLGGCPHEYDDDWPFHPLDAQKFAPGSNSGDPCVWCPESKP